MGEYKKTTLFTCKDDDLSPRSYLHIYNIPWGKLILRMIKYIYWVFSKSVTFVCILNKNNIVNWICLCPL